MDSTLETLSFAELLSHPLVSEASHLAGKVGFMAFHGGNLERTTEIVAREAAEASGASWYTLCQAEPLRVHVSSASYDPALSPTLAGFVDHVDVALAIHGYGRMGFFTSLLLGGSNRRLASHVGAALRPALPHYEVLSAIEEIPKPLRGVHPRNPVNLPRHGGVQIELPPRVRGLTPYWGSAEGTRVPHLDDLIAGLAEAARTSPKF